MSDQEIDPADDAAPDDLAALIRAGGRRAVPRAGDYERVLDASRAAWQRKLRSRRRRTRLYGLAAAVAMAAVGLTVLERTAPPEVAGSVTVLRGALETFSAEQERWEPLAASAAAIPVGTRLRTGDSGGAAFRLATGAALRVDRATEWEFVRAGRIGLAGGTLYVDSGGTTHPDGVEISTELGIVRDIGTQFEVSASARAVRVRVREGLVSVQPAAQGVVLQGLAGEELEILGSGELERRAVRPDDELWSWTQALAEPLHIDGRSAFEALTWVARETGNRLVFEDATAELRARQAILSGDGDSLTPMEILQVVVATTSGLDYALGNGTLVIRRR